LSSATSAKSLFIRTQTNLSAARQHSFNLAMRSGNYMNTDQLANTAGCSGSCIGRGLNGTDIAAHEYRDVSRPDVLLPDQLNICGFDHSIRGFNCADESLGLDHSECF
jgi:hypothetical protein